jgi:aconitate hydratase 2/2-methylisocitrate dehydratase
MGVGSSRMSGVNNVALWTGKSKSICSLLISSMAGTNGFHPYYRTTVSVVGWILNWVKYLMKRNADVMKMVILFRRAYSVAGTVLTINKEII